jgi:hypothetical protein
MTQYKYLTQQQINCITKHYTNQETADDVQELLVLTREVGLDITTTLVTFEDYTADLVIKREDGQIKYFGDLCSSHLWLSNHIQAFGGGVEIALDILDDVLAWTKEGEKEELNTQVLKANYLIDLLMREDNKYYLGEGTVAYDEDALEELSLEERKEVEQRITFYSQMLVEIPNRRIREIMYMCFDHGLKYELPLLIF